MFPSVEELTTGHMLLIDKPLTWTSFDVIGKLRYLTHVKMGHAGTLDPLATGLLIVCTGKFTKKINEFMGLPKTYTGEITLGATTPTYDLESVPENQKPTNHLTIEQIREATKPFVGDILQMPPMHSAIKKNGKRLYEYARKGVEIEVAARPVHIDRFLITGWDGAVAQFEVHCGTGTYIRSLAHDFGAALGCGGYLSKLIRTEIGHYDLTAAHQLPDLVEHYKSMDIKKPKK